MSNLKMQLMRTGLDALYLARLHRAFEPFWGGIGVIFTLHHVRPEVAVPSSEQGFHPNRILEITPEFLDEVIGWVASRGLDLVTLEEACRRIRLGGDARRFVCFTIDDGYRDNLEHALPVFRRHGCPFTLFVTTSIVDGTAELWWQALEQAIARHVAVTATLDGERRLATETPEQKWTAFHRLYDRLREMDEDVQRAWMRDFAAAHDVDMTAICAAEALDWDGVRKMARDPLVTVGAHTVDHYALCKLPRARALAEMTESRRRIAEQLGEAPEFFCYPYGGPDAAGPREFALAREAGFAAAVTTRKGVVFPEHADHLHALPRVSLNGDYQDLRYVELFLSGAPFALWNGFRRVNAA